MKTLYSLYLFILIPCFIFAQNNGTLEATNGVVVGNNTGTKPGTIRWSGTDFQGYTGSIWKSLTASTGGGGNGAPFSLIQDADGDTKIETEFSPDIDRIVFTAGGSQIATLDNERFDLGSTSLYIGSSSGLNSTGGAFNTGLGRLTLADNTTGRDNTAIGNSALSDNTTGRFNTALGSSTLQENTTGDFNIAAGAGSLRDNTTGDSNTAFGNDSLGNNTTGDSNTAVGNDALFDNIAGEDNTAVGEDALENNNFGNRNTAVGVLALRFINTGQFNTAIGYNARVVNNNLSNLNNFTCIGYQAIATANNQVRVGDNNVTSIGGQVGWTTTSDERFKTNVSEDIQGLNFINGLRPVSYNLDLATQREFLGIEPEDGRIVKTLSDKQTGFIAQEVHQLADDLGFEFSGVDAPKNKYDYYGLRYAEFVVPLVKAVQELSEQNEMFKMKNEKLSDANDQIITRLKYLENQLAQLIND